MGHPTFMYHPHAAPDGKLFDSDDLPSATDGWVDSPTKFEAAEAAQHMPGSAFDAWFENIGGSAHDKKLAVEHYARETFGVELDRRRSLKALVGEVKALESGADHGA